MNLLTRIFKKTAVFLLSLLLILLSTNITCADGLEDARRRGA